MIIHKLNFTPNKGLLSFWAILLCCFAFSCSKKEFMPTPEGKAVFYTDTSITLKEFLKTTPSHSLFWQAWQRSNIEKILTAYDPKYTLSLLLPDNAAMESAGYTSDKIKVTPAAQLDSLMRMHVIPKRVMPEAIAAQSGNLELESLLKNPNFYEPGETENVPGHGYRYRHYIAIREGRIEVDGRALGLSSKARVLKGASVFPISKVLVKPVKTIRQLLFEDGRFTMYLAIRRHNDSLYNVGVVEATYLYSTPYEHDQYALGYYDNKINPVLNYLSAPNYSYDLYEDVFKPDNIVYSTTILVPTDDAFKKAGFAHWTDFAALNERAMPFPTYPYSYTLTGYLPTDSVLNNHYWGYNSASIPYKVGDMDGLAWQPFSPMVLYSNDLRNEFMTDYKVSFSDPETFLTNPLEFIRNGETIQVRVKGSQAEPATIINKDIEAFNGVIHVVDRLLIPKGFRLN